ncbi:MAG: M55 family metallopeptidase [Actinomycetota bacterium]
MKVFVSSDMEGVAGIVDWAQCIGPGTEYERGRALLQAEVNAAIDGALEAGADEIVVNDSHWLMRNLDPEELHGAASYVAGFHKPLYMMEGLDASFDVAFFVAYHGSVDGPPSVLSHTYNPRAIAGVRLDGRRVGESGINALVAAAFGVPVGLVTGDDVTCEEARPWFPGAELVQVKRSITRVSTESLHPERARGAIRAGAAAAVRRVAELRPPSIPDPVELDVRCTTSDVAELAATLEGIERVKATELRMSGERLEVFRRFVTMLTLTRQLAAEARG